MYVLYTYGDREPFVLPVRLFDFTMFGTAALLHDCGHKKMVQKEKLFRSCMIYRYGYVVDETEDPELNFDEKGGYFSKYLRSGIP